MTGKERAALRKEANTLTAIFQIGKEGLTVPLLKGIDEALTKRELVKMTVLETCPEAPAACGARIAEALEADVIQSIGRKVVLYRKAPEEEK